MALFGNKLDKILSSLTKVQKGLDQYCVDKSTEVGELKVKVSDAEKDLNKASSTLKNINKLLGE